MASIIYISRSDVIDITRQVVADDGWGLPPSERRTRRGVNQDGDNDVGSTINARLARLGLFICADDWLGHFQGRDALIRLFNPRRSCSIRWINDTGIARQFECVVQGSSSLSFSSGDRNGYTQQAVVELRCADPYCYDPAEKSYNVTGANYQGDWDFPLTLPASFGQSQVFTNIQIPYRGAAPSFPRIILNGPMTNPVITHTQTGATIALTGTTLAIGQQWIIDTHPQRYGIYDQAGASRINSLSLSPRSTLIRLLPHPDVTDGVNVLRFEASALTATSSLLVRWYDTFWGV